MSAASTILVSGEALVDLIPTDGEAFVARLGGSPFNVAIGLGRLGTAVAYAGRLSTDAWGQAFADRLRADGVALDHVTFAPAPSPLAFVTRGTQASGARYAFYLGATAYDGPWPLPSPWPHGLAHLHVGSFAAIDGAVGKASLAALRAARGVGSTSFDPNIRPHVTPDRAAVLALVEARIAHARTLKASEEDAEWLYPGRTPEASAQAWATMGPDLVVLTCGERGAVGYAAGMRVAVPAPAATVVDTVGAGDSFMAALLSAQSRDGALGPGARAHAGQVERWLRFAACASAITCTREGADPPTLAEVEAAMR